MPAITTWRTVLCFVMVLSILGSISNALSPSVWCVKAGTTSKQCIAFVSCIKHVTILFCLAKYRLYCLYLIDKDTKESPFLSATFADDTRRSFKYMIVFHNTSGCILTSLFTLIYQGTRRGRNRRMMRDIH